MLQLFKKYNTVLRFIFIFLGSYFIFSLFYNGYLVFFRSSVYYPDFITHLVAKQSESLIKSLGYSADILPHQTELSMKLYVNKTYLARIVEGCNAISIMILFSSFILAFFGRLKLSLIYILAGSVLIYAMNLIRIALLAIGIYEYPEYASFSHSILFPLVIYGTVFFLWVLWVRIYANTRKKG
ncbi:exosortase family protein XrtF [Salegentibacter chungangensis]|uniref:Exosortase family protein XrtF n=1 Tax=Salegentibacter chungangensis TaxID=1335724 RepID=A0ABW3NMX4_9FLAO